MAPTNPRCIASGFNSTKVRSIAIFVLLSSGHNLPEILGKVKKIGYTPAMITDREALKLKQIILQDIYKIYEELFLAKKISDEDAKKILEFVKTKIAPESHAEEFSRAITDFAKEFPAFKSLAEKVLNAREETVETIGRECLEEIMDEDTDTWSKLTITLEKLKEENLHDWFATLPDKAKQTFLKKFLTLSEDAY